MQSLSPNYIRRGFSLLPPASLPASPIVWTPRGSGCAGQVWYHQRVRKEGNLIRVALKGQPRRGMLGCGQKGFYAGGERGRGRRQVAAPLLGTARLRS